MEDGTTGWDPFDGPIFADKKLRALQRVGVVDVGSNSVRLVIFDGAARSPAYFFNEKIMCALGAGMAETGKLNPEGRERALRAMKRFKTITESAGISELTAVATAAVRDASDGADFVQDVFHETGVRIFVIDGPEEARLSAQGVLLGWPGAYGLICDIGGASLELAEINDGQVGTRVTSELGPLKLRDVKGGKKGRKTVIRDSVTLLRSQMGEQSNRLFLVGGSWRAIARIDMERRNYPLHVLHEYRMTARDVRKTAAFVKASDLNDLRSQCGISAARMDLVPIALEVLPALVSEFKPHDIAISSYGIREGMLYEQMPQNVRDRDPLVEAARFAEAKDARLPGFGKTLYDFVLPLFGKPKPELDRLIRAACYLHDVSWRAHPDYRAEIVFDNATRANLGGLNHSERIFLGVSLLHRYRNSRGGTHFEPLYSLLDDKMLHRAEVLGKAMRLGAMLWADPKVTPAALHWAPKKKVLTIKLTPYGKDLWGEVVEARFNALAATLGAETQVK